LAPNLGTTSSDGSADTETLHAFTIIEYKKGSFDNQHPGFQPPDNRVNCKYVLLPEDIKEAHAWIKSIQANIDIVRPPVHVPPPQAALPEPPQLEIIIVESDADSTLSREPAPPSHPQGNSRPSSPARNIIKSKSSEYHHQDSLPHKVKHVDEAERIMSQSVLPLSLTFDHQNVAMGDSTRSLPLHKPAIGMGSTNSILSSSTKGVKKINVGLDKGSKGKMSNFFSKKKSTATIAETTDATRNVFGVTLEKAIGLSRITDSFELPAVIYRCIEYLEGKDGMSECLISKLII
jgi:hypothetical protein